MNNEDMLAKLWRRIERHGDCWIWNGALNNRGGGRPVMGLDKTTINVQKVMWLIYKGEIQNEKRQSVFNHCGNDKCLNPEHLFLSSDNTDPRRPSCLFKTQKRFWKKVKVEELEGCWEWQAALSGDRARYGFLTANKRKITAHRFVWEMYHGNIPNGLIVRHKCDNTRCVNPIHLELGTHADNTKDMDDRGRRGNRGEKSSSPFTEIQVRDMRGQFASGKSCKEIAETLHIKKATVYNIVTRRTWRYLS